MCGITKKFPGVVANDCVDFEVQKGHIHALLGENGSGKSTLMKILYGLYQPDAGEITVNGKTARIACSRDAIKLGICMIHQNFMLAPQLTVIENIIAGYEGNKRVIHYKEAVKEVMDVANRYGLKISPNAYVHQLSVGEQQRVEIIKGLYRGAEIMILDEPTAVLTPNETTELLKVLRAMADQGKTIIFITHKLEEVLAFSDEVTVLRNGKKVATVKTGETSKTQLARLMIGRDVVFRLHKEEISLGAPVVELKGLTAFNESGQEILSNISLEVRQGEILGVAGVDGNGQLELSEVLAGMRKAAKGVYRLKGTNLIGKPAREIMAQGVAFIPAERNNIGAVTKLSVSDNLILKEFRNNPFSSYCLLNKTVIDQHAQELVAEFQIKVPHVNVKAELLSGGNLQKVILARELSRKPSFLIAVQPTRGLDVGAIEYVRKSILDIRKSGTAVLLISTELEEILALSDRITVMFEGKLMGILNNDEHLKLELLSLMMSGGYRMEMDDQKCG